MQNKQSPKTLIVISGLAGSGKTIAIHALEDLGYYCVDNLPACLLKPFVESLKNGEIKSDFIALALDARDREMPRFFKMYFAEMSSFCNLELLFLDSRDEIVMKRFRETRRQHPLSRQKLSPEGTESRIGYDELRPLSEAIVLDRQTLAPMRTLATRTVDTSDMSAHFLRQLMRHEFAPTAGHNDVHVNLVSFGFKYGVPQDLDTLYDVRCFANPHYVAELRPLTGLNKQVNDFVFADKNVSEFISKVTDLLLFLYPLYQAEGKRHFGVGIGCTGGKHRSVAIVEELNKRLHKTIHTLSVEHRHFDKE